MKYGFRKTILLVMLLALIPLLIAQGYFIRRVDATAKKQVTDYADMAAAQIEENFNNVLRSVSYSAVYLAENSMMRTYLMTADPLEIYRTQAYLGELIRTVAALGSYTQNVLVVHEDGALAYMYDSNYRMLSTIRESGALQTLREKGPTYFLVQTQFSVYPVCAVPVYSNGKARIGTVLMPMNLHEATRSLKSIDGKGQVELFLLGPDDTVISSNTEAPLARTDEKSSYTYIERELSDPAFRVVCRINNRGVTTDFTFFQTSLFILAAVMILLLLVIALVFNRLIANPIAALITEVNAIGANEQKNRIHGSYGPQLDPLVQNINRMLQNISALTQEVLENQKKMYTHELMQRESDLYALRNQINPHFLFNTLQTMSGIAILHGEREVSELAAGIAQLFFYALKGDDTVYVEEELDMLRQYLEIMRTRLQEKFTWSVDVPPALHRRVIPKMLLQPLVENAMTHGIEKRLDRTGGLVHFSAKEEDGFLLFTVEDNGDPDAGALRAMEAVLSDEENLYLNSRGNRGIGLANIQYRVKLLYDSACGLCVTKDGDKTRFTLKLRPKLPEQS